MSCAFQPCVCNNQGMPQKSCDIDDAPWQLSRCRHGLKDCHPVFTQGVPALLKDCPLAHATDRMHELHPWASNLQPCCVQGEVLRGKHTTVFMLHSDHSQLSAGSCHVLCTFKEFAAAPPRLT